MTHAAMAAPIGTPSASTATAMISLVAWLSIGSSSSAIVGSTMAPHALSVGSSALKGSRMAILGPVTITNANIADVMLMQALLEAVPDCATVYSPKMPPTEKVSDKIDPHFRQAGATL